MCPNCGSTFVEIGEEGWHCLVRNCEWMACNSTPEKDKKGLKNWKKTRSYKEFRKLFNNINGLKGAKLK